MCCCGLVVLVSLNAVAGAVDLLIGVPKLSGPSPGKKLMQIASLFWAAHPHPCCHALSHVHGPYNLEPSLQSPF